MVLSFFTASSPCPYENMLHQLRISNIGVSMISVLVLPLIAILLTPISYAQNTPQDYLNAHNKARSQVGVGPMTWNTTVASYAQNYVNTQKRDCSLVHSGGPYGENLAGSSGDLDGTDAVNLWVDEKSDYDYNSNSCDTGVCGHYTQVVWQNSIHLGCAKVRCNDGGTFISCNYDPPGNYVGQRPYSIASSLSLSPSSTSTPTASPSPLSPLPSPLSPSPTSKMAPLPSLPSPSSSYSTDQPHHDARNKQNIKRNLILGVTGAVIAGLLICIAIYNFRYKALTWQGDFGFKKKSNQHIEEFLRNHAALTLKKYKLSDVKKMTHSFEVKLGQGGFGAVYKGKLPNGCLVAVKMLNVSKRNGEEFINEVASISRTSHINVVTLLGFCLEGSKSALIYEYMSNGSLEKFIHRKEPDTTPPLSWDVLYQIAIGIARGLEYLHKGCNTRILHFDIKPHNILLDENFCPKISDFGLAKLCPRKESIISMSDARGTIGYVAPEVLNRHFAGVSHKSDVYSYGMMLLEMVGGRKNINAEASHTSEIYFPHWAYKRLEVGHELRPDEVMTTEENEIAKRMTIVGLWCIQTFPNDRPTMSRVIEMLEGNMNSLEIPPKPLLSSPTRSTPELSIS